MRRRLKRRPAHSGMTLMIRFLILFLVWSALALPGRASDPVSFYQGKGLTVQLVADVRVVRPGETFQLGLWIKHEPGYHTYWQNPGLAGVPTKLNPKLPAEFKTGAMVYPPPDKVKMASIRVHGYERDVLVALPVTVPAGQAAGPLAIPVAATWMCCRRTCNPGLAQLTITVTIGETRRANEEWLPKFKALEAAQPPVLEGWTLTAARFEKEVELIAHPPAGLTPPAAPQFFSSDNLICSHPLQNWQRDGAGYRVRLALSDFLPEDQTQLRGLLYGQGSWLAGREMPYAAIAVPLGAGGS